MGSLLRQGVLLCRPLVCIVLLWHVASGRLPAQTLPSGLDGKRASFEEIVRSLRQTEFQTVTESSQKASLSLEDLSAGIKKWRKTIQSIHLDLTLQIDRPYETASDLDHKREGRLVPSGSSSHVDFALKGNKLYQSRSRMQASSRKADLQGDAGVVTAFNGSVHKRFDSRLKSMVIEAREAANLDDLAGLYLALIVMPIGRAADLGAATSMPLPPYLQPKSGKVVPVLEVVDGHPCHVVTSGMTWAWIDHDCGFCIRRRVVFRKTAKDDPGCLLALVVCKDLVEVDEGLWLPKQVDHLVYTSQNEPESQRGRVTLVNKFKAGSLRVNDVPDSLFELEPPPGTQIHDLIQQKVYIMPRGIEMLDKAIAEGRSLVEESSSDAYTPPERAPLPAEGSLRRIAVGAVVLLVIVIFLTFGIWRRTARSRKT